MSDLISRSALIKRLWEQRAGVLANPEVYTDADDVAENICAIVSIVDEFSLVEAVPQWIPCGKRMPEERDSVFKKAKGTDKWSPAMFEGISDDVNVTVEFEDGTRTTKTSHTLDGKWKCEKDYGVKMKVIAWMPLPDSYKGE